jgi:putative ubiquitin-RnfH superfamily antitoxin RatB of RatAB toxin-antitoxin module
MNAEETWHVEVAYATPACQEAIAVVVRPGMTIEQTIRQSGILARFPEIDLARNPVGVFGELAGLRDLVRDLDRVEIYRPLIADPKAARKQRAARGGKKGREKKSL